MGIVLPHIFWAPSSWSSCFSLPRSPPCTPRPTPRSPTRQATTFPTPTARPSPTPPTLSPPSSTPPPPVARTTPALWCLALTVASLVSSLLPLLPLLSPLLRRRGRRGRPTLRLRPILRLRLRPGCSTGPTATGPSATATLPTATLPTPTPATTATTASATTTATTAGRRGRQPPKLRLRLPLRPIPGCCTVGNHQSWFGQVGPQSIRACACWKCHRCVQFGHQIHHGFHGAGDPCRRIWPSKHQQSPWSIRGGQRGQMHAYQFPSWLGKSGYNRIWGRFGSPCQIQP